MDQNNSNDSVRFTVVIPRSAYDHMKEKARFADVSMNKFLVRAGSIVTKEQVASPPWMASSGAATQN